MNSLCVFELDIELDAGLRQKQNTKHMTTIHRGFMTQIGGVFFSENSAETQHFCFMRDEWEAERLVDVGEDEDHAEDQAHLRLMRKSARRLPLC